MWQRTALLVGIAVALGACRGSEQRSADADSAIGAAVRSGMAKAESGAAAAAGAVGRAVDTLGRKAGDALDTMGRKLDTAAGALTSRAGAAVDRGKSAASSAALRGKLATLSSEQVKQLQTALNDDGCNAGPADGTVGPRTVRAVRCSMRKHNIDDGDVQALYRALGLDFGS